MKFLIVKISAIGDVVMALGMSTYIREKYPEAAITWICGEIVAPLLKATNAADQLITVNEPRLFAGNLIIKITELLKIWSQIFLHKFDVLCIGHADFRYHLLVLPAIAKIKRNFRHYPHPFPIPGRYHANEYLRLVTGKDCILTPAKLPKLTLDLPTYLFNLLPQNSRPAIALVPGGAKNLLHEDKVRRWSIENYVQLSQKLLAQGYNVIITGGISDLKLSTHFSHLNVINVIGKTTLLELIALYQHCYVIVTHDTGTLHLAKLTNTHIIALFGPTMPFEKIDVSDPNTHFLWNGQTLPCCPCYDGENYANCENNQCLQQIKVEAIYELVTNITKKQT